MVERMDERLCVRFELDERAERGAAAWRVAAAMLSTGAGLWLFSLPFMAPRLIAAAGFVFAALWIVRGLRMLRSPQRTGSEDFLELRPDVLCLCQGGTEHIVPWNEVTQIAIDEDRLLVVVERKNSAALLLEPQYRGVGLRPMAEAVQEALVRSRQSALGTQAAHG